MKQLSASGSRIENQHSPPMELLKMYPLPDKTKSREQILKLAFDRGLTIDEVRVLLFIIARSENGDFVTIKPTEMAETVGFANKNHVSRIISALAENGYIEKKIEGKVVYGRPLL